MEIVEAKLLKSLSTEDKLVIATRALCQAVQANVLMELRFSELLDRLDIVIRGLKASSWTKAINAELERRENVRGSVG